VSGALAERLRAVEERVAAACARAGRDSRQVRVLPISKTQPVAALEEAVAAGCRRFGENRVQEMAAKAAALAGSADLSWTLVGHLQTNKARDAVAWADELQSLDSLRLAAALQNQCERQDRRLDVLIEVNTSAETSKFGLPPADLPRFTAQLAAFDRLRPRGLMTVALPSPDPEPVAACFSLLSAWRERLRERDGGGWPELSMGMSQDFELAVACGSTCVRIGTAVFGARPVPVPEL
jgi:pyridoxal phosphate enzyme (YggS family)